MTDITLGSVPARTTAAEAARDPAKKSLFRRIFDALVEARTLQAERLIKEVRENRYPGL
jgi:hypothetical protein